MDRGKVFVNEREWQEQLALAARQLGIDLDPKTIVPPAGYRPPSIHLFFRNYSRIHAESFESFRGGTILTWDFIIREDLKKSPSPYEFKAILRFVGEHGGFSQFGNKFGFGRFELLSVEPSDLKAYCLTK